MIISQKYMKDYLKRTLYWIMRGIPTKKIYASVYQLNANNRLKGKKVLITGGGRGLGYYIAKKLIADGAKVVIVGRNEETLKEAAKTLDNCPYIPFDIQTFSKFDELISKADELIGGGLNCLINNAGISLHEQSFEDVSLTDFDRQFNTNIKAPYFLTQSFLKYASKHEIKDLNVVFVTSERGLYCDVLPYGLTKAAINSLTAGLARRYLLDGIRVNAIAPGVTASDMTRVDKTGDLYRERACGKRVLLPEEIAEVTSFVLSDESGCITGEVFPCNQGNHLRSDF